MVALAAKGSASKISCTKRRQGSLTGITVKSQCRDVRLHLDYNKKDFTGQGGKSSRLPPTPLAENAFSGKEEEPCYYQHDKKPVRQENFLCKSKKSSQT